MSTPSPAALRAEAARPSATFMGLPFLRDIESLDIAVLGVPWDGGTPVRVGSRHGPEQIRAMSERIHGRHPIYGVSPFELCAIGDIGDVTVPPFDQQAGLLAIEAFYRRLAAAKVSPVTAGGDHLVTLPVLRAIAKDRPFALVQFDAHCDTADTSRDGNRYSSSTPFRRAIEEELLDPRRVVQIGIRGPVRSFEKMQWALDHGVRQITVDDLHDQGIDAVVRQVREIIGDQPTYVTFDIDGIDPAFAPGTGAPVVGGLTSYEAQRILRGLNGARVLGGDVVEVSPPYDLANMTSLLGASLLYEILCLVAQTLSQKSGARLAAAGASP